MPDCNADTNSNTMTNDHTMLPENLDSSERFRAVRSVLLAVLIANLAVTLLKIIVGLVTGVLAVVADGFHSMVDSSSNLIGLAAISLARRLVESPNALEVCFGQSRQWQR